MINLQNRKKKESRTNRSPKRRASQKKSLKRRKVSSLKAKTSKSPFLLVP